jgi:L-rhamnose mutarotase
MARVAFRLRVRADRVQDYEAAHQRVWPELLQLLKKVGITEYSIFRREVDLFLYMRVDDFERAWSEIEKSPVNSRWQKEMEPLFEPLGALEPGERFPMMREIFYLE